MLCFLSPRRWESEFFCSHRLRNGTSSLSKPWRCPCQGETVRVKFVYNRLSGENGAWPNQISHHLQKSTRRACPWYSVRYTAKRKAVNMMGGQRYKMIIKAPDCDSWRRTKMNQDYMSLSKL